MALIIEIGKTVLVVLPGMKTQLLIKQLLTIPASMSKSVGDMLASSHVEGKARNRQYLLKVAQNIHFLWRLGIALHGDNNEYDSNFVQLMYLRAWMMLKYMTC